MEPFSDGSKLILATMRFVTQLAWLVYVLLFFASASPAARSLAFGAVSEVPVSLCTHDVTFDDATDVQAARDYITAMQEMLAQEKFDDMDCIADFARSKKIKSTGGMWKLHLLYGGLEGPHGHATEEDWSNHFQHLNRWIAAKPDSITARVALAGAYESYAWQARGTGYSDTVSESGWRLFGERVAKSRELLEQSRHIRDPEWYLNMQIVALDQGWDKGKAKELLDEAIAFEPAYYYYFRAYSHFVEEKWFGEEGESERFAADSANRVGGTAGDILYFQIAENLICICTPEPHLNRMSWPRIQRGFSVLEKQNGTSLANLNMLAYMALKESDSLVAHDLFLRIGENWDEDTWKTESFFDSSRNWAAIQAPRMAEWNRIRQLADANMQADWARQETKQFIKKFGTLIQHCLNTNDSNDNDNKFELMFGLGMDGSISQVQPYHNNQTTDASVCLLPIAKKIEGEKIQPPPARAYFWLKAEFQRSISVAGPAN